MRVLAGVIVSLALVAGPAAAVGVTIDGEAGSDVTLTIENAPVEAALKALHERYGFELEGLANLGSGEVLNATLSGSVADVVTRLLRNWNHLIVKSEDARGEISKVVIINATYGVPASKTKEEKASAQQIESANKAAGEY